MKTEEQQHGKYLLSGVYNQPMWQIQIVPTERGLPTRSGELPPIQHSNKEAAFGMAREAADELNSN